MVWFFLTIRFISQKPDILSGFKELEYIKSNLYFPAGISLYGPNDKKPVLLSLIIMSCDTFPILFFKPVFISKGDLLGTNSEFKTLSVEFETKEKAEVEIRSFYNGKGELKIKELVLYKID